MSFLQYCSRNIWLWYINNRDLIIRWKSALVPLEDSPWETGKRIGKEIKENTK